MIAPQTRPFATAFYYVSIATLLSFTVSSLTIFGTIPSESAGALVPVAQLTPFVAAMAFHLVRRQGRFTSVFALGWGRSWTTIALGLVTVTAIGLAQLGVAVLGGASLRGSDLIAAAAIAVPGVLVMQCIFAIGEEFGWRGWLITQLETKPFWQIAMTSSLAWVIWHLPALPLIISDGGGWQPVAAYLLAIASWAPFMVALRLHSGSVWPAVIVHGALNSIRVFLTQSVVAVEGVNWFMEIAGWVLWLAAAAWLAARGRHVAGQSRPPRDLPTNRPQPVAPRPGSGEMA